MIAVTCPHCTQKLNAPDGAAGKSLACPRCKKPVRVPGTTLTTPVAAGMMPRTEVKVSSDPLSDSGTGRTAGPGERQPSIADTIKVPGYEVLGELGRGGMGVVYKARQKGLKRLVALKMVLAGAHSSAEQQARFRAEAEAVARLQHPNIVQVYEVGESDEGNGITRPFMVLEFVDGGSLENRLGGTPLAPRAAAGLVQVLTQAVQAAHEAGIVHRDLKPANILLMKDGNPKVTDFGLAKQMDAEHGQTQSGAVVGTPSYMSPEQALGNARDIGPATDVYALGAILYELLTGCPPFRADSPMNTVFQVATVDPVPPTRLQPKVPLDLETICLKCLEKSPHRRYRSASDLAEDLRRFLNSEPISARPSGRWERTWKWARRRPAVAAMVALVALVTLFSFGLVTREWLSALDSARAQVAARDRAAEARQREAARAEAEVRARQDVVRALRVAEEERSKAEILAYAHYTGMLNHAWLAGEQEEVRDILERCPSQLRQWEWYFLDRNSHAAVGVYSGDGRVVFSADGKRMARGVTVETAMAGYRPPLNNVKVTDLENGQEVASLMNIHMFVFGIAMSPDGKKIATSGGWDLGQGNAINKSGEVKIHNFSNTQVQTLSSGLDRVRSVAFSPDSQRVAADVSGDAVRVWTVADGREQLTLNGHGKLVCDVAFSPNGKYIASGSDDTTAKLWDAQTGREVRTFAGHKAPVQGIAFSPDSERLACASADHTVTVWETSTGKLLFTLRGHLGGVWSVAFSPDGNRLATGSSDETAKVWNVLTGQEEQTILGHTAEVRSVAFHPDGKRLATTGLDHRAKVWDVSGSLKPRSAQGAVAAAGPFSKGHTGAIWSTAVSGDGRYLGTASEDKSVRVWDRTSGREVFSMEHPTAAANAVAFSPDGRCIAGAFNDRTLKLSFVHRVWGNLVSNRTITCNGHTNGVLAIAFSPDGALVASSSRDRTIHLWDAATGREAGKISGPEQAVTAVAFSPDGSVLGAASDDKTVRLWDTRTWKLLQTLRGHTDRVRGVAFSPNGKQVVSASWDRTLKIWDAATGRTLHTLQGHTGGVLATAFLREGKRLASASEDRTVRIWDVATGQETLTLRGHSSLVWAVAFSPDGGQMISADGNGDVRVWDAAHTEEQKPPEERSAKR